jgi:hypothetical protein
LLLLLYLLYEDALDELNGQGRLTNATASQNDNLVLQHVVDDLTDAIKSSDLKGVWMMMGKPQRAKKNEGGEQKETMSSDDGKRATTQK